MGKHYKIKTKIQEVEVEEGKRQDGANQGDARRNQALHIHPILTEVGKAEIAILGEGGATAVLPGRGCAEVLQQTELGQSATRSGEDLQWTSEEWYEESDEEEVIQRTDLVQSVGCGETRQTVDSGCVAGEVHQLANGGHGEGETRMQSLLDHGDRERLRMDQRVVGEEDRSEADSELSEESVDPELQLTEDCAEGDEPVRVSRIRYLPTDSLDVCTKNGEVYTIHTQKLMSLSVGGTTCPSWCGYLPSRRSGPRE